MSDLVMTTAEVAAGLKLSVAYFRKRRRKLAGFPAPLPGGRTWSRAQVAAWIAGQSDRSDDAPAQTAQPTQPVQPDQVAERRRERRERAKQLAIGAGA